MDWRERIAIDPQVLAGKPVIKGTRPSVESVVGLLAGGWSEMEIVRSYSGVTREDIRACLQYASDILNAEKVYPLEV